ncbi:uncharacterized protein RSE6_12448 [Rhynchosporium secalis]|uniref:SRR1-like domain-containing protein n=1 Tax=Rhynchosporium secalis TaxID=38038 RepID=A0A1E1MQF1_RHYSE|nr:uncharacterized protein RSE6_12448 [Rhynchosporium secalis]
MSEQDLIIVQHSIAMTSADVCRKSAKNRIRLLAQDPDYTMQSQKILEEYGFEIVGKFGAGGFSEINEESIVFSPFVSAPVKQILADIARPALVISDGFGAFNDSEKPWAEADSPRTQQMWQEYQSYDFPVSPDDAQLNDSNLHKLILQFRIATEVASCQ